MISAFRSHLNSWVVRAFFLLMVAAFIVWGVGDVIRNMGHETWVAKVGDRTIEPATLQERYQRELARLTQMVGQQIDPTPEIKRSVLTQVLDRMITELAIAQQETRMGIVVPRDSLLQAIYAVPQFKDANGRFDPQIFQTVLRNNGLTEARLLQMMSADLSQRQLLEPVRAGVAPPDILTREAFAFTFEQRAADMVELPFAKVAPPTPEEAALHRWYDNHPDLYSTPEYRRIKLIVLSPQTLAKEVQVSDADLQAAYERHRSEFVTAEKRSAQVVSVPEEARAAAIAQQWRSGADWAAIQKAAAEAGGSGVELTDATRQEFPGPELAQAVFDAPADKVMEPEKDPAGAVWHVIKVTRVTPGKDASFEQVRDALRDRVAAEKAADLIYDRANKIDNALGGGSSLDELPNDLGVAAVTGTLDAQGNTQQGGPAPIPGPAELRQAVIKAAFEAHKGDPPHLIEVPAPSSGGSAYYALTVEEVSPPAEKPFDEVADRVRADWERDAIRHEQEQAAAKILAAVKGGQSLEDAATVAGLTVRRTAFASRTEAPEGFPKELLQPLFGLNKGEPTMVETPDGFVVAVLAETKVPDPKSATANYAKTRDAMAGALANDVELIYASVLRERARPRLNQQVLNGLLQ
ncbi:MAG: SurA N-terminal domain-containing protein [Acetobacteraceae bacterium]|nr:SurA N-terminal domain-containing protein [Acetobacteraceae bacterium]